MKGKQVAVTLYLSPRKYWLLKALSHRNRVSMQRLLRQALEDVLREDAADPASLPGGGLLAENGSATAQPPANGGRGADGAATGLTPAPAL